MTGLIDIWGTIFPSKHTDLKEAFEEHSKKVLDKPVEVAYTTNNNENLEHKEPVVAKVTVEEIVNAVGNTYPAYVIELAKILRDMKLQYSLHASAFSSKLFDAQDSLGLTSEEVRTIIGHIIDQKDVIIQTTQASIDVINKL